MYFSMKWMNSYLVTNHQITVFYCTMKSRQIVYTRAFLDVLKFVC